MIRQCCFSGSWYPDDKDTIDSLLDSWFSAYSKQEGRNAKCVIVPHAGWRFSGSIASSAFKQFQNRLTKRVFIFGPCHHYYTESCLLSVASQFETPLGNVKVDRDCIAELEKTGLFDTCDISVEEDEHSLEIELPFIMKCFGNDFQIVPIMVGKVSTKQKKAYAKVLKNYLEDDETVFVISSDFCHWGSAFHFQYYDPSDGEIWESIEKLDKKGASLICNEDADGFAKYIDSYHNTICGRNCIEIMLRCLQESNLNTVTEITKYGQSSHCMKMNDRSVSYCAMVTYIQYHCLFNK